MIAPWEESTAVSVETPFQGTILDEGNLEVLGKEWSESVHFQTDPRTIRNWFLEARFNALARAWKQETLFLSTVASRIKHPAYRKVIQLGELVIPYLLREMDRNSYHWHWALKEITSTNPVPEGSDGDMRAIKIAWLEWGRSQGYYW